jgi:hypothetical protein
VRPGASSPDFARAHPGYTLQSTAAFRSVRNWCGRKERNPASARLRTIHAPGSSRSFRAALPPRARSPRCGGFRHFRHRPDRPLFTTPIFTSSPAKQARVGEMFLINLPASCGLAAHNMRANLSEFGPGNVRGGFQTRPYEPREDFRRGDPWVALHPPQSSAAVPDFVRARSGLHSACRASGRGGFQNRPYKSGFALARAGIQLRAIAAVTQEAFHSPQGGDATDVDKPKKRE